MTLEQLNKANKVAQYEWLSFNLDKVRSCLFIDLEDKYGADMAMEIATIIQFNEEGNCIWD